MRALAKRGSRAPYHALRRQERWLDNGECWDCRAVAEPGRRRCTAHRLRHAAKERERRLRLRARMLADLSRVQDEKKGVGR